MVDSLTTLQRIPPILIGVGAGLLGTVIGAFGMLQLDDYRIGRLEYELAELEKYVSGLENRERMLLQRVSVLEVKVEGEHKD